METRRNLNPEFIETPTTKEVVLFANTPTFLLDRLRKDTSASYVSHELSTDELLDKLRDVCSQPLSSPSNLILAYVLLAALSIKDDRKDHSAKLDAINLSKLQWGDAIRKMINEPEPSNNYLEVKFPKIGSREPELGISNNRSHIILSGE